MDKEKEMNFEEAIKDIKTNHMKFKDDTNVGDIILALSEEGPIGFGKITDIVIDTAKKDEWWFVTFDLLSVPIQSITWILRTSQFTGKEIFTMNGIKMFVAAIDFTKEEDQLKCFHYTNLQLLWWEDNLSKGAKI